MTAGKTNNSLCMVTCDKTKTNQNIPLISMVELRSLPVSKGPVPLNDTWNEIGKDCGSIPG